jgi:hypothetical protein
MGAYRLGDGAPVTDEAAQAIWVVVAREVLEEKQRRATTIYRSDLAKQVQTRSGVHTRAPLDDWLARVLHTIAEDDPVQAGVCRPDPVAAPAGVRRSSTPHAPRPRAEPAAKKRETTVSICPTCFMQLPVSGRCENCA